MKKNKVIIKLISLTLSAVCLLSLVSCSNDLFKGVESTEDELRVVGTVGNYEVHYDELYYLVMSCNDIMKSSYGKDIWKDEATAKEYADELEAMVMERITTNYAVLLLCEEYGLKEPLKNKDIIEGVNDQIEATLYELAVYGGISVTIEESLSGEITYKYEKGGKNKAREIFKEALEETYLTERVMRLTLATELAFNQLTNLLIESKEIVYDDNGIEEFMFSDKFICTRHIFVSGTSDESLAKAEAALAELKAGVPMENLIAGQYNDDVTAPDAGYYFTLGEMEESYETAAFALKLGEISDIVKTDKGYFIIQRCEKSSSYMLGNISAFAQQIINAQVNVKLSELHSTLSLEKSEFGSSLEFYKIAVIEENKGDKK